MLKDNRENTFTHPHETRQPMTPKRKGDDFKREDPREMPAYSVAEAAHYLQIPETTLRSWVLGRHYKTAEGGQFFKPLIDVADREQHVLSFFNLVEAHVLNALRRKHKISLAKVRLALDYLNEHFPSPHLLAERAFETDGANLFLQRYGELINLSESGQLAMRHMLKEHLRRIGWDAAGHAAKLYLFTAGPKAVVVDPRISFGRPVIAGTGIPTRVIAQRFKGGDSIELLAKDYGRSPEEIQEAIRCEQREAA